MAKQYGIEVPLYYETERSNHSLRPPNTNDFRHISRSQIDSESSAYDTDVYEPNRRRRKSRYNRTLHEVKNQVSSELSELHMQIAALMQTVNSVIMNGLASVHVTSRTYDTQNRTLVVPNDNVNGQVSASAP